MSKSAAAEYFDTGSCTAKLAKCFCLCYDVSVSALSALNHNQKGTAFMKEQVLKAMKEAGKPMSASEVAKATGLDKADVDLLNHLNLKDIVYTIR